MSFDPIGFVFPKKSSGGGGVATINLTELGLDVLSMVMAGGGDVTLNNPGIPDALEAVGNAEIIKLRFMVQGDEFDSVCRSCVKHAQTGLIKFLDGVCLADLSPFGGGVMEVKSRIYIGFQHDYDGSNAMYTGTMHVVMTVTPL